MSTDNTKYQLLKDYYSTGVEDKRLQADKAHQVEFLTTTRYIDKYLKPNDKILEVGAGTGAYSIYYAEKGYEVNSLELVPENINILKSKITKDMNINVTEGTALDLSCYENNTFDMTLVLGPLYHLYTEEDKKKAIEEALRVTKPNGYLYIAYLTNDSVMLSYGLKKRHLLDKGLFDENYKFYDKPEEILSHHFFIKYPKEFYEFYRKKLNSLNYKPNAAHKVLAYLEEKGLLKAVITQNIDGFHQMAGSKNVIELHGSVLRNYCMKCNEFYDAEKIFAEDNIPRCDCGGIIKPDVVLYEENLDDKSIQKAIKYISEAEVLIIGGTSLNVYPAAGLINYFKGKYLVLINKEQTPYDRKCTLTIYDSIGIVLEKIKEYIEKG